MVVQFGLKFGLLASCCFIVFFFFFKQKTAYEILTCDWSSDVCSSDLNNCRYPFHWSAWVRQCSSLFCCGHRVTISLIWFSVSECYPCWLSISCRAEVASLQGAWTCLDKMKIPAVKVDLILLVTRFGNSCNDATIYAFIALNCLSFWQHGTTPCIYICIAPLWYNWDIYKIYSTSIGIVSYSPLNILPAGLCASIR